MTENVRTSLHSIAIVGPYLSRKTTLLKSFLFVTGAISRKGSLKDGNMIGDNCAQGREHQISVEVSVASTAILGCSLHLD